MIVRVVRIVGYVRHTVVRTLGTCGFLGTIWHGRLVRLARMWYSIDITLPLGSMHDSRIIRPLSNQYFHDSMIFFCHRLMFSSVLVMYTSWMILLYLWVSTIGMMSMSYGSHVFFLFFSFSLLDFRARSANLIWSAARQAVENPDRHGAVAPWNRWKKLSRTARRWSHGSLCKNRTTDKQYLWNM